MKHEEHICRFNDGEQSCDCYDAGYKAGVEESIALSDKIEMSEPDGGTKQWMAFKHFRNKLRDSIGV